MVPMWRVEMLGSFVARSGDDVVSRFRTRRVGLLLAYLAYHSGQRHDRGEIGELLWPEGDPDKMSANLRQALASLRRQVEVPPLPAGSVIRSENARLSVDPKMVTTDVAEFEATLDEARKEDNSSRRRSVLEKAVALYRGELLPGYNEDWVLRERARLEDVYVHTLRALAECAQADGHSDHAIDALHRSLAQDPYNERVHADLMRIHLEAGQPASALEHYKDVERRLADELGVAPDESLRMLARQARRALQSSPPKRQMGSPPTAVTLEPIRLPAQLTQLFGRQAALDALIDDFVHGRVAFATVLGPAGVGKTTHAVAVARNLAQEHGWYVGFVPMADYTEASMVLEGIADALGAHRDFVGGAVARVRSAMRPGSNLVVLDNAEHILEELAPLVASLRSEIPDLRLLVTSRQSLKVADEHEKVLDLLGLPNGEDHRPELLARTPSVALFVDRARAVQPDFGLTPRNARAIAEICLRLDGLPLAIELAAGMANVFTPSQMIGHLDHRFTVLRTRRRDAPLRHRSLSVALDYSYDTLSETQKQFFNRLSVFRGGFTLEAASRVVGEPSDEVETLRALLDLQERSLIFSERMEDDDVSPRFRLLESFREYSHEHLTEGEKARNAGLHADYFLSTLLEKGDSVASAERRRFRHSVLQDRGNYWEAVNTLIDHGRLDEAVTILDTLASVGPLGKPQQAEFEVLQSLDPTRLSRRSQILRMLTMAVYRRARNEREALGLLESAVALAREEGDPVLLVRGLTSLAGSAIGRAGPEAALELYGEIRRYDGTPDVQEAIAYSFNGVGTALWLLGRMEEAEAAFREGLLRSHEEPGEETHWLARYNLARVLVDVGRYDEALPLIG
ncbi:hypothetical protein EON82_15390, partial [bacterium]